MCQINIPSKPPSSSSLTHYQCHRRFHRGRFFIQFSKQSRKHVGYYIWFFPASTQFLQGFLLTVTFVDDKQIPRTILRSFHVQVEMVEELKEVCSSSMRSFLITSRTIIKSWSLSSLLPAFFVNIIIYLEIKNVIRAQSASLRSFSVFNVYVNCRLE